MSVIDKNLPWFAAPAVQQLWQVTRAAGVELRLVGGAVRNALLGAAVTELDFAINVPPERCEAIFQAAGIKTIRTGFEHGTITAVIDGQGFEITSLRADIKTDGRHALVTYTNDWAADAARRDFTINALYADQNGKIYDYGDGVDDLRAGRVRFIGDAALRIAEDHLRILRFFRFHAWYGKSAPDPIALQACSAAAAKLSNLSVERIWQELKKLLAAPEPVSVVTAMLAGNILSSILPEIHDEALLKKMIAVQKQYHLSDLLPRFAVLLPNDETAAEKIGERLRLSLDEQEQLAVIKRRPDFSGHDLLQLRLLRYRHSLRACRHWLQILAAEKAQDITAALALLASWQPPVLPVNGNDVMQIGVTAGPAVGQLLRQVETWWLTHDFQPDRAACLAQLRASLTS
jgi:poly(A) polymerase